MLSFVLPYLKSVKKGFVWFDLEKTCFGSLSDCGSGLYGANVKAEIAPDSGACKRD